MNNDEIRTFIAARGYSTLTKIKSQFPDEKGDEILKMNLTFLVEKNRVRKVKFQSPTGPDELYYVLPE